MERVGALLPGGRQTSRSFSRILLSCIKDLKQKKNLFVLVDQINVFCIIVKIKHDLCYISYIKLEDGKLHGNWP